MSKKLAVALSTIAVGTMASFANAKEIKIIAPDCAVEGKPVDISVLGPAGSAVQVVLNLPASASVLEAGSDLNFEVANTADPEAVIIGAFDLNGAREVYASVTAVFKGPGPYNVTAVVEVAADEKGDYVVTEDGSNTLTIKNCLGNKYKKR